MAVRATIEKRRQQVYDLCVRKSEPIESVASTMQVSPRTIRNDVQVLHERLAEQYMKIGQKQLLVDLIEHRQEQRNRIYKRMADDIPETSRCKYEALLMENDKLQRNLFKELADLGQKGGGSELEDTIASMSFGKFNEMIGLPIHPHTKLPGPVTQAQLKVFNAVHPSRRSWIVLNKSRQCGFTEICLRIILFYSFSKYRGKKIAIVTGTRVETTLEIFSRLKGLCRNISETVKLVAADRLILKNGTEFHVVPASKNAINGWSSFSNFMLDESSMWDLSEDQVILDSFLPIARTNSSDVFMISNPNGPRGFFYHILQAPSPSWTKLEIDIHEGGKELYTPEQIQEMIDSTDEDPASSYLCKFVGGRNSIFGDLAEEDRTSIYEAVSFD